MNKEVIMTYVELNKKVIVRVTAGAIGALIGAGIGTALTKDMSDLEIVSPNSPSELPTEVAE